MKEERFATLPSVLAEYGHTPYEEPKGPKRSDCSKEEEENTENLNGEQQEKNVKQTSQKRRKSPQHRNLSGHRKSAARTVWGRRGSEAERLEWIADTWEQARAEILQERHEVLNRKLVLQHALVKAQDRRAQLRRHLETEAELKKREEEKKLRKDKIDSLESQCKQSLSSDRKSKRKPRTSSENEDPTSHDGDAQSSSDTTGSTSMGRRDKAKGHTGYLPSDAYRPASNTMQEVMNEEEEEAEDETPPQASAVTAADGVVTPADLSEVPWHHAQLYKMYGRNADYYIHPKMQVEKKKVVHPTLKRQKGHLGAGHIWSTLRSDSTNKLLRTDRRFPSELKEAFGAHVRDGITKHKKPVFRNFTETQDVPDLPRLLDQSLLRRIRVLRHKTELMYRSSQTNHDRTKILLFNSPLPEPNEGDQGIGKYLPSWDTDVLSDTPEASYLKWLKKDALQRSNQDLSGSLYEDDLKALKGLEEEDKEAQEGEREEEPNKEGHQPAPPPRRMWHPQSVLSLLGSEMNESLHDIWHKVMSRQRPRKDTRYHFLTEAEARTKGDFLAKLGLEPDKIDCGRVDLLPSLDQGGHGRHRAGRQSLPVSMKAMSAPRSDRGLRRSVSGQGQLGRSESAQYPSPGAYESRWQPLSMQALVEYKEQLGTDGTGEYSQGRPPMWRTKEATAATAE